MRKTTSSSSLTTVERGSLSSCQSTCRTMSTEATCRHRRRISNFGVVVRRDSIQEEGLSHNTSLQETHQGLMSPVTESESQSQTTAPQSSLMAPLLPSNDQKIRSLLPLHDRPNTDPSFFRRFVLAHYKPSVRLRRAASTFDPTIVISTNTSNPLSCPTSRHPRAQTLSNQPASVQSCASQPPWRALHRAPSRRQRLLIRTPAILARSPTAALICKRGT